jgi:sugar phosphate isomerase/epimerase
MQFIFSTGSLWSYSIERCFAFAAQAGFDGVEIMVDQRWETRQADYLRRLMNDYQLPIMAVHSPFMVVPGWPEDNPGRILCSVTLAEAVGAQVVVHHLPARVGFVWVRAGARFFPLPAPGWNPEKGYRHWVEGEYQALQASTPVTLCIENMPAYRRFGRRWNYAHWNTPAQMSRFPAITLDTTHLGTWGLDPVDVYPRLNSRVRHVHLSNYDGREHRRPEDGRLRLKEFLGRLAADNYQGAVSLELFPEVLDAGSADEKVVERMAMSLRYCRE